MNGALPIAIGLVAILYSSVGHAGATGYVAVMTLAGLAADIVRPTALVLNLFVATIATLQFIRAGHFRWNLLWPLAMASVPSAFVGGMLRLPTEAFEKLVGIVLILSAVKLLRDARPATTPGPRAAAASPPSIALLAALGCGIGLLSGLTGVGGGVFLTPVLLAVESAPVKRIAGITAPFILVNSLAGLAGGVFAGRSLPTVSPSVIVAAVIGGTIGSHLGAFRLPVRAMQVLMAAVLAFAGARLFWA